MAMLCAVASCIRSSGVSRHTRPLLRSDGRTQRLQPSHVVRCKHTACCEVVRVLLLALFPNGCIERGCCRGPSCEAWDGAASRAKAVAARTG